MEELAVALLVDVGSTWTKAVAVALPDGRFLARAQAPTTIQHDVMIGVNCAAEQACGDYSTPTWRAACSSAAGGLRVAAVGLVPDLTVAAAREASLGAGARVVAAFGYILDEADLDKLAAAQVDIVLLAGGTDGGNEHVVLENARRIAAAGVAPAVILAGNRKVSRAATEILESADIEVRVTENVLPTVDTMNVEPARAAIRALFLERIVEARGIQELRAWADGRVVPTPAAVLDAAELVADDGAGTTVVVDIGGATTDVHSVGQADLESGVVQRGLPAPRLKRSVEGDLGLRVSAEAALESLGAGTLANRLQVTPTAVADQVRTLIADTAQQPKLDGFDAELATLCTSTALVRHCGFRIRRPTASGSSVWVQSGKDLRQTDLVIGTGGIFASSEAAPRILDDGIAAAAESEHLVPLRPKTAIDRRYIMSAVGLLSREHRSAAIELARRELMR